MIAAGFLPACTALWHRGVFELVHAGWWRDLPAADRWVPAVWLGIPAAVVTLAALAAAALSRARLLIVVIGLAGVVHPVLPAVLAPLALAVRTWPARRFLAGPVVLAASIWVVGFWLTPACLDGSAPAMPLSTLAAVWARAIGLPGGVLLGIDLAFRHESRRSQLTAALILVAIAVVLGSGLATDVAAILGASAAVLWWRVAAGASRVIAWQTTTTARIGATALVALVPLLAAAQGTLSAEGRADPSTAETWSALESAGSPAAIMTTGGRADTATAIWRAGRADGQQALAMIPPDPEATSDYMATRAVYGWSGQARRLSMYGMVVAPRLEEDKRISALWRVLNFERCHALTSSWTAISVASGGQIAGLFPESSPNRGALIYLSSARRLDPRPLDWPAAAEPGFESTVFDRSSGDDVARLEAAVARDGFSNGMFGEARFAARVRFDRRPLAPDALAVTLGGVADAAWARLYSEADARDDRRPMLCRSSVGQPIVGYPGAPAVLDIDLTAPYAIGSGWFGAEQVGDGRFRWSGDGDADVLFLAEHAQPLLFRVDAQPGTGSWETADMRVALNGTPVHCRSGTPPCDWMLPAEAVTRGLNVLTLRSETVQAPPPDPRRLGLLVRSAQLVRP
jgi:hypothetical protein